LFKQEFGEREGEFCFWVYKNRSEPCPNCPLQKTFEDKQIHSSEETVIRSDGTEMQLIVYSSPIFDEDGNIQAVMEMATDITEVKKLQQELTLMGRTIAVMAHRIKNILMGLEGGIFVVNTGMEENNEADIKQGWEMIERNVDKISHIVRDLLFCSKDREMKFEQVDPATVIRNVYELFAGRAEKEGIHLNLQLPESLPEGRFDPDALHSLLTNLVANSFDACVFDTTEGKDRHEITIRGVWEEPGRYVFEVEDNGIGIPGINGESVFEEFFSTKGREGTGLGLLVAHKVAEEHGGTITFDSRQGEGTTFRAIFPGHKS
jgi:signal transduction histidine kinase